MENKLIKNYFEAWNKKDLLQLSELVHDNIFLKDWENEAFGVTEFLKVNEKIFNSVDTIKADVLSLVAVDNKVFSRLKIKVNRDIIQVVDYFEIENGKIAMIQAYRCF